MPLTEAITQGLGGILTWPAPAFLVLGVLLGIGVGVVPGIGGLTAFAMLLPLSFVLDTYSAISLLLGMYAVTTSANTITAVLLGVPGTSANQATILDGYPMAKKGEAGRAFGAAYTVSAFGGAIGGLLVLASLPVIRPLVLSVGSPEFFTLGLFGLAMVGVLSGKVPMKGLVVVLLALGLSMVGSSPQEGVPRFALGQSYLIGGIPLVPAVLGLFALPELLDLLVRRSSISRVAMDATKGMLHGVKDAFRHWWLALRSIFIGVYIGIIPGMGASVVDWAAYGHAVQSEKHPESFGEGDVRGVIAPEAANNAMKGGALIPTLAVGVPGNAPMALLLAALTVHGISPGPGVLSHRLDVLVALVGVLVIANLLAAGLLLGTTSYLARLARVKGTILVPILLVVVLMGAWMSTQHIGDWVVLFSFGVLGYFMRRWDWPRPPIALGLVLGPLLERYLHLSINVYGMAWLGRPIVLLLLAMLVLMVAFQVKRAYSRPAQ